MNVIEEVIMNIFGNRIGAFIFNSIPSWILMVALIIATTTAFYFAYKKRPFKTICLVSCLTWASTIVVLKSFI